MKEKESIKLEECITPDGIRVIDDWDILDVKGRKIGNITKCFGKYEVEVYRRFKTREDAIEWVHEVQKVK